MNPDENAAPPLLLHSSSTPHTPPPNNPPPCPHPPLQTSHLPHQPQNLPKAVSSLRYPSPSHAAFSCMQHSFPHYPIQHLSLIQKPYYKTHNTPSTKVTSPPLLSSSTKERTSLSYLYSYMHKRCIPPIALWLLARAVPCDHDRQAQCMHADAP